MAKYGYLLPFPRHIFSRITVCVCVHCVHRFFMATKFHIMHPYFHTMSFLFVCFLLLFCCFCFLAPCPICFFSLVFLFVYRRLCSPLLSRLLSGCVGWARCGSLTYFFLTKAFLRSDSASTEAFRQSDYVLTYGCSFIFSFFIFLEAQFC